MATHHWIIICGIKHHVQVGITAGCGRVYRVKDMEDGDDDGDVDEDDHRGDDSPPDGTPVMMAPSGRVLERA